MLCRRHSDARAMHEDIVNCGPAGSRAASKKHVGLSVYTYMYMYTMCCKYTRVYMYNVMHAVLLFTCEKCAVEITCACMSTMNFLYEDTVILYL